MKGWCGKILLVDLTGGELETLPLDPKLARDYIGGRGLGIKLLLDRVDPLVDPLSPENELIMATGPLTGTTAPTGARYMIMTKSPLTGAITCSNSGGHFPSELKKAGWDAILFTGRATKPVYLWIEDQKTELRDASHIWGMEVPQADEVLKKETLLKARTTLIGPAGENGVLFASVMNDKHRAAGRSGVGAVMGSKNLKAVVVKGSGKVDLADPEGFKELAKGFVKGFKESFAGGPVPLRKWGTPITAVGTQNVGVFPTRNFQFGQFEKWDSVGGEALTDTYLTQAKACHACPIACGRGTKVPDGPYAGEGEGPEYETIYAFGSDCGVDDLAAVTKANYICNEMGMDTITMGATIACAMEMSEKGLIPAEDVGLNRELKFGDAPAIVELTRLTGERKGFGRLLGLGSLRLATHYGHPEFAMVAKGQEFAGYDPRGEQGMGLAYATSPIGASHMRGDPAYIEILGVPKLVDPLSIKGKPQLIKDWQDVFCVIDAAGVCVFFSVRNFVLPDETIKPEGIKDLLNAATGLDYSMDEVCRAGERIFNAERVFLNRAGFKRAQDTLPPRMLSEPVPEGPAKGMVCRLEEMLTEFYTLRGWTQDGVPSPEKLGQLGLA
ncbi:aldehyde ferredoxin oxidoreductase family protein [Dethiosulfatarculus sandiegensis]|uniref:Aldehyde ferredoxin oxidoreductase n=1 Tax=Dethiosulfatarculus sandiegensis TaxID=1429043 RepID=A0A0D2K1J7_9BACT|nr:aldehyde ferredoxin oxidoreductase family protein [Dethiosulfatarculus sandiegensis]KIX15525.1 aldehyde ferredoxin oxidoreductase [Dethiosulfatarculus sandiegensis]